MAWIQIGSALEFQVKKEGNNGASIASSRLYVAVEYDNASLTTTSVKIRFKGYPSKDSGASLSTTTTLYDRFYIIANNTLLCLKGEDSANKLSSGAWHTTDTASTADIKSTLTLIKTKSATKFTIPEFYVGAIGVSYTLPTSLTYFKNNYYTTWWQEHTGCTFKSSTLSSMPAEGRIGTIEIADNGNNSFKVTAETPTVGTNNPIKTATLTCNNAYISSNISASCKDAKAEESRAILSTYSGDTLSVTATVAVDATYGTDLTKSVTATINFYRAPSAPTNVKLDNSSFKNGRLTIKQDWKFTWDPAEATNTHSPVAGYSFRLYKNGEAVDRIFCSGNELILDASGQDIANRDLTAYSTCELVIDPVLLGFEPKDTVQLGVQAYARNGLGKTTWSLNNNTCKYSLYSGDTDVHVVGENETKSTEYEVENAGVVKVKTPDHGWVEGQVWVKDDSGWREAETVLVKTPDGWMESQ